MAPVCVIREHYVPQDSRVAREVAALHALGHHVDVICLRAEGQPRVERSPGGTVWRLPPPPTPGRPAAPELPEDGGLFLLAPRPGTRLHPRPPDHPRPP